MHSAEQTADLVLLLLRTSGRRRARLASSTIRWLSGRRKRVRAPFLRRLTADLDERGISMLELDSGGFGLVPITLLEGAPRISGRKHLPEIWQKLERREPIDFAEVRAKLATNSEERDDVEPEE